MKAIKINNKQIKALLNLETIEELLDFCKNNNIPLKNAVQVLDYANKSMDTKIIDKLLELTNLKEILAFCATNNMHVWSAFEMLSRHVEFMKTIN